MLYNEPKRCTFLAISFVNISRKKRHLVELFTNFLDSLSKFVGRELLSLKIFMNISRGN